MRVVEAEDVHRLLDYPSLITSLEEAFRADWNVPARHHHRLDAAAGGEETLLLMPAWQAGQALGVKIVTVFPRNGERGLPAVLGQYLLLDPGSGRPLAAIDGPALTARRTAAASALASSFLSRSDAAHLLVVGTGAMAPQLVAAHAAVRPIRRVSIWGRRPERARALADSLADAFAAKAVADLAQALPVADIVSTATLAREPLLRGEWLRPGQHLDLVGGFTPEMREVDDDAVRRARIYVDTSAGALAEAGDLVQPIARGVIAAADLVGDLSRLVRGLVPGRRESEEITLFKSVGTALEDLAAALLIARRLGLATEAESTSGREDGILAP